MPDFSDAVVAPYFTPHNPGELWALATTPHPTLGQARHLGEALVQAKVLDAVALTESLKIQQAEREQGQQRSIGQILVEYGHVSPAQLQDVIGSWLGKHLVHPGQLVPDPVALALVPRAVAERESVLPLLAREDALVVLMADPADRALLDELRFLTQRRLIPLEAAPGTLMPAIANAYRTYPTATAKTPAIANHNGNEVRASSRELVSNLSSSLPDDDAVETDVVSESDNTLVRLINTVIEEAIAHRASDIHIETEPDPQNVRIRLRVDGELMSYLELPARFRYAMVARIKIMASMDISEHRKPQTARRQD